MLTPVFRVDENLDDVMHRGDFPLSCVSRAHFKAMIHWVVAANLAEYGQLLLEGYHVS